MITLGVRRFLSLASLAFFSVGCASSLFGTLTSGGGLVLLSTSVNVGPISSTQTLTLDMMAAETADVEIRVVNIATSQVVAGVTKIWNYQTQNPGNAYWSNGSEATPVSISSELGQDFVDITSIPAGNYRVELDVLLPDYWASYPETWWLSTNTFNGEHGSLYIDVGASVSDVWSWGGAGLILQ